MKLLTPKLFVSTSENETPRFRGVSSKGKGVFGAGTEWLQPFLGANRNPLLPVNWVKNSQTR